MSNPGSQMTPEMMQAIQQYQDQQRRQQMAQSFMQNSANPQTQNSGIANAGSDILGAITARNLQNRQMPNALGSSATAGMSQQPGMLSRLFNLGGGS
jgi:hypothetical protein